MRSDWLDKITTIYGVECSLIVDKDGLVVSQAGSAPERIAPHSALMVKQLMEKIGVDTMDYWEWTQCETENAVISISYVYIGIMVIIMRPDANISKVRIEANRLRKSLSEKFKKLFIN
ncbi:MAG: hypothetical protein P9X24_19405 [Candidatus Hatepunaea meridiana]|nr:hypothetical protein [Candidatus Hatepunaea meridiana]